MYPTAEVRWFLRGALPASVADWFHEVAGEGPEETRTDRYVRPTGPEGLGVKGRTGNLEVKRLARVVGTEAMGAGPVGRVENWRKWSFPLGEEATLHRPAGDWVEVEKRRRKAAFAVREGGVERVRREASAGHGCSLEIADVGIDRGAWWSVSLEAFGSYDEDALVSYLRRAAAHVFADGFPTVLPAERSLSYPAWLWALGAAIEEEG